MNKFTMFETNNISCSTRSRERTKIIWVVNEHVVLQSNNLFNLSFMEERSYFKSIISITDPKLIQPNTKLVCKVKSSSEKAIEVVINKG